MKIMKMPLKTKHFNKNQKVIIIMETGDMAAKVRGRFRGKHRYVNSWIRWEEDTIPKIIDLDKD